MTDIYQKAYTSIYPSRLGDILLAADEIGLTGLWFFGQSYFADTLPAEQVAQETPILAQAREWLDEYFSGKEPDFTPKLHPIGSPFRQAVWRILLQIPYGQTMTYGEIARQMEKLQNRPHMSAQAVGGALGRARGPAAAEEGEAALQQRQADEAQRNQRHQAGLGWLA